MGTSGKPLILWPWPGVSQLVWGLLMSENGPNWNKKGTAHPQMKIHILPTHPYASGKAGWVLLWGFRKVLWTTKQLQHLKSKKESDGSVQPVQHNPSLWIQGFRRLGLLCRTSCMESGKGLFTISSASAVQENAAALVCCRRSRNVLRTTKFNPKMEIQSSSIHSLVDEKGTVPPTFKVNEMLSLSVQRKVFHEVICWNTLSWQFI